jgi:hypothetical protein
MYARGHDPGNCSPGCIPDCFVAARANARGAWHIVCLIPIIRFRLLFVFFILIHPRRCVLHVNIAMAPSAEWASRQLREAFLFEKALRYLIRDRDGIYGSKVGAAWPAGTSRRC